MVNKVKRAEGRAGRDPEDWEESQGYDQLYQDTWQSVLQAWKRDQSACSVELADHALRKYPTDWGINLLRGSSLASMRRYDLALPALERCLSLGAGKLRATVCQELGDAYRRMNGDPRAAEWYEEAAELGRQPCRVTQGQCLVRLCRFPEAEAVLTEATGSGTGSLRQDAWAALGWLHLVTGNYMESRRCYGEASSVGDYDPDLDNAIVDAERAAAVVREKGGSAADPVERYYALSAEERDRYPALAAELAVAAAAANPVNFAYLRLASGCLGELGRYAQAETLALRARDVAPSERVADACYSCGDASEKLRKLEQAEGFYRQGLEAEPDFADRYVSLGCLLNSLGRLDEAEEVFRTGTNCSSGFIDEAYLNVGNICRAQRRYSEAVTCFRRAIMIDPEYTAALESLEDVELVLERFPHLASY